MPTKKVNIFEVKNYTHKKLQTFSKVQAGEHLFGENVVEFGWDRAVGRKFPGLRPGGGGSLGGGLREGGGEKPPLKTSLANSFPPPPGGKTLEFNRTSFINDLASNAIKYSLVL